MPLWSRSKKRDRRGDRRRRGRREDLEDSESMFDEKIIRKLRGSVM